MIPSSPVLDQSTIATLLAIDPLVQEYRAFFSLFDWSLVDHWQAQCSGRGRPAHPEHAYLKALLLRIHRKFIYSTELRHFLVTHPLLIIELGFHLVLDPTAPYGFDVEKTLPCRFWFGKKLHDLDQTLLQQLLHATVTALQAEIPALGETTAFDVKHLYAWVKENNERVYVPERYDKAKQLAGDPDCRLGVKKSTNKEKTEAASQADAASSASSKPKKRNKKNAASTEARTSAQPEKEKKELIWGYGSGVAAATNPIYGDVVLAEYTQPFHANDITYFWPLYRQAVVALNQFPTNITADAAFDAWYTYETAARHGGIGAIPLKEHSSTRRDRDAVPFCEKGLRMIPTFQFKHTYGYCAQRFRCPLLFPEKTDQSCDHAQFVKGKGCVKDLNWELGGKMRVTLDRENSSYQQIYKQRTSAERINSQAKEFGIERPKVRNIHSVRNLNTLTYLVINVRALDRAKSINKGIQQMN